MGWLKRQWNDVKGNAKWQGMLILVSYIAILPALSSVHRWLHHPATTLDIAIITAIPFVIAGLVIFINARRLPRLNIVVSASSGPSENVSLVVKNLGHLSTFTAFAEIIGYPNGINDYPRGEFRCGWDDGSVDSVQIDKDQSQSILVASVIEIINFELLEFRVWQVTNRTKSLKALARWHEHPDEFLPKFIVSIRIVGVGTKVAKLYAFTIGPYSSHGPLEISDLKEVRNV